MHDNNENAIDSFIDEFTVLSQDKIAYFKKLNKPVMGWCNTYVPEEIIMAAGFHPYRVMGSPIALSASKAYMSGNICSSIQSILECEINGEYSFLEGMIIGAATFFLMSVICTLGAGLLAWGALAYLIGTAIFEIIAANLERFGVTIVRDEKMPVFLNKEQRAIVYYIREEKAGGISEQEIALALKEKGWSEAEITAAINMCKIDLSDTKNNKICPTCFRTYDNTWKVCLNCNTPLIDKTKK